MHSRENSIKVKHVSTFPFSPIIYDCKIMHLWREEELGNLEAKSLRTDLLAPNCFRGHLKLKNIGVSITNLKLPNSHKSPLI